MGFNWGFKGLMLDFHSRTFMTYRLTDGSHIFIFILPRVVIENTLFSVRIH